MRALWNSVLLIAFLGGAASAKPFLCYWEFWGVYRNAPHQGTIDRIPVNLCTHVIYSFVGLDENTNTVKPLDGEKMDSDLRALRALKDKNSALKVIAAIGGWGEGAAKYSRMASNENSINSFVASVAELVKKYDLDGFDVDWEFPGATDRGASPADKVNLITLLQKLRSALSGKLLTIAVAGPKYRIDGGYDVPNIAKNVDYINVMSYDLRGPWDQVTGNHVGLYGSGISVSQVMSDWHKAGAPKNKLIMGIAFYGKSFTLNDPNNNGPGSPAGVGQAGEVSKEGGSLFYYEICDRVNNRGWKRVFDDASKTPYAFGGNQWVGYEDVEGIKHKTDLINKEGYAGAMVWAIELDDQTGVCGGGKFPLANAVSKGLGGNSDGDDDDKPEPEPTTANPEPRPTPSPQPDPTPRPQPDPTPRPQPDPTPRPQPDPTPRPQPDPTPRPQPDPTPRPQPDPTPRPQPDPTPRPQPDPTPSPNPGPTPDCSSGAEYLPHTSKCSRFYHCAHGHPFEKSCPGGLIFDNNAKVCNWPDAVDPKLPAGCPDARG